MKQVKMFCDLDVTIDTATSYCVVVQLNTSSLPPANWLTPQEWLWLQNTSTKRQSSFAWGRATLRWVCSQLAAVEPNAVVIALPSEQTPALWINQERWFCSISHSKQKLLIAVNSKNPVAVDLEYCRADRVFTNYQQLFPQLSPYCASAMQFYRRWTLLETLAKFHAIPLVDLLTDVSQAPITEVEYIEIGNYLACITPVNLPRHWFEVSI